MGWKTKEKPLTAEEAIELAKRELAPYWNGSKPLLAAVESGGKASVHPLDNTFATNSWAMFFLDPFDVEGDLCLEYFRYWYQRYNGHSLKFLLVFCPTYQAHRTAEFVKAFAHENYQLEIPIVLDYNGMLSRSFGEGGQPKIVIFHKGERLFLGAAPDWINGFEATVQKFLRIADPGLPLELPMEMRHDAIRIIERLEMGAKPTVGKPFRFGGSGFNTIPFTETGTRTTKFDGKLSDSLSPNEQCALGEWTQDKDRIYTSDKNAALQFHCKGTHISLIAQTVGKVKDIPRIAIEVNGRPALDDFFTPHICLDDEGQTYFKVDKSILFPVLHDLREDTKTISLRFYTAHITAIAIYSISIGECREHSVIPA